MWEADLVGEPRYVVDLQKRKNLVVVEEIQPGDDNVGPNYYRKWWAAFVA